MKDIDLLELRQYIDSPEKVDRLLEVAAGVANAIHAGAGDFIRGSMMEDEFRKALGLKVGQFINLPVLKRTSS